MPPVIQAQDQNQLVETAKYPLATWKFKTFNPVQSRVLEYYDQDINGLVAAATSAGKTVCAEMFLAHEVRVRGGKGMYLGPLKALTQEKIDDWTDDDFHFHDQKVAICTGDYRLTKERKKEFEQADLIIMTSEMLNHRSRNFKSEQNQWMLDVGTLVVDESHLLTVPKRGDHLEVGLMKFTDINPKARIIMLSATMPNVEEIGDWVSYTLTKRNTFVLRSSYRPCPLSIHYEKVFDQAGSYFGNEQEKVAYALEIVDYYPDDKFLIFSHTIDTGYMMTKALQEAGIQAEFHCALLDKAQRVALENRFRTDPKLRCVVATSTLAWGLNMPARRVIVLGITRGFEEVESYNIAQMVGRSGRVGLDPMGDAYILLPERTFEFHKTRLKTPEPIHSHLLDESPGGKYKTLAFHLVSEIHHGDVKDAEDVHRWFNRSLAHFQSRKLDDAIVDKTIDDLKKCYAIKEEDGELKATAVGMISSMFYISPFDVSDLRRNFKNLFDSNEQGDDLAVACALSAIDTNMVGFANRREKEEMANFMVTWVAKYSDRYPDSVIKAAFCYHCLLNGHTHHKACGPTIRNLQSDFARLGQVLLALDNMSGKWGRFSWFRDLQARVTYGVKAHLVPLVALPNVGKARAAKLWEAGLKTLEQVAERPDLVKKALGFKDVKVQEIVDYAKGQLLVS
jgi:helicase